MKLDPILQGAASRLPDKKPGVPPDPLGAVPLLPDFKERPPGYQVTPQGAGLQEKGRPELKPKGAEDKQGWS